MASISNLCSQMQTHFQLIQRHHQKVEAAFLEQHRELLSGSTNSNTKVQRLENAHLEYVNGLFDRLLEKALKTINAANQNESLSISSPPSPSNDISPMDCDPHPTTSNPIQPSIRFKSDSQISDKSDSKYSAEKEKRQKPPRQKGIYNCFHCQSPFRQARGFESHNVAVHNDSKPYHCSECDKSYTKNNALTEHINSFHRRITFKCEHCVKTFTQKGKLTIHIGKEHPGKTEMKEKHQCFHCQEKFQTFPMLEQHNLDVHGDSKPHHCTLCDMSYKNYRGLRMHVAAEHLGKTYRCEECGKTFKQTSNLRTHQRNVHKQRNYACSLCEKRFALKRERDEHERQHNTKEKPFECNKCHKAFTKKKLKKHRCKK